MSLSLSDTNIWNNRADSDFVSNATSSLISTFILSFVAQRVLWQRGEEHKWRVLQYLGIFAMGLSKKSLIISYWIVHLPVFLESEGRNYSSVF